MPLMPPMPPMPPVPVSDLTAPPTARNHSSLPMQDTVSGPVATAPFANLFPSPCILSYTRLGSGVFVAFAHGISDPGAYQQRHDTGTFARLLTVPDFHAFHLP